MSGASDGDERLSGSCSPDPVRSEQSRPRTLSRPVPVPPARLHRLFSLQGPGMARKFSAPGQLCVSMTSNLGGSAPGSAASATSLGHFPKSMCPPQQYGFPTPPFGTQWSGTGGPAPSRLASSSLWEQPPYRISTSATCRNPSATPQVPTCGPRRPEAILGQVWGQEMECGGSGA